jgi:hypothetical protein
LESMNLLKTELENLKTIENYLNTALQTGSAAMFSPTEVMSRDDEVSSIIREAIQGVVFSDDEISSIVKEVILEATTSTIQL